MKARQIRNKLAPIPESSTLRRRHGTTTLCEPLSRALQAQTLLGNQALRSLLESGSAYPTRCSCGGTCTTCSDAEAANERETASRPLPLVLRKSVEDQVDDEFPTRPDGGCLPGGSPATIVCDGSDGYRVDLGGWAGAKCGVQDCIRRHEESHIGDWKKRYPDGCKGKKDGDTVPTGGGGYDAFLRKSECDAYNIEIPCEEALVKGASKECKPYLECVRDDSKKQRDSYCGGC